MKSSSGGGICLLGARRSVACSVLVGDLEEDAEEDVEGERGRLVALAADSICWGDMDGGQ